MSNQQSDFICLYCGSTTTIDKSNTEKEHADHLEHLFPYSMGGKEKLPRGDVCNKCNGKLSDVDRAFKHRNTITANAYQVDDSKRGRNRDQARKDTKKKKSK